MFLSQNLQRHRPRHCTRTFLRFCFASESRIDTNRDMGGAQAFKRIPRIKFPQRHPKPSGSTSHSQDASSGGNADLMFLSSSKVPTTLGGKASLQPKRTPLSNEEIEAIMLGGCI